MMEKHVPCRVGDIIYSFAYPRTDIVTIGPELIEKISPTKAGIEIETDMGCYLLSDLGKRIFLTKEEAKAALQHKECERADGAERN